MKLSKRDREILAKTVFIPPVKRGKLDPKVMWKALQALYARREQKAAKAKAERKSEANGQSRPAEAE